MQVEIDLYSGREAPTWPLTAAQCAELEHRLSSLAPTAQGARPDGLGYRGLAVRYPGAGPLLFVGQGTALLEQNGAITSRWVDADRGLERWLLSTGLGAVDAEVIDAVHQQTGGMLR